MEERVIMFTIKGKDPISERISKEVYQTINSRYANVIVDKYDSSSMVHVRMGGSLITELPNHYAFVTRIRGNGEGYIYNLSRSIVKLIARRLKSLSMTKHYGVEYTDIIDYDEVIGCTPTTMTC